MSGAPDLHNGHSSGDHIPRSSDASVKIQRPSRAVYADLMMEITQDVILDLLPLYLADKLSPDARTLVDNYLETDPELARIAKQLATIKLKGDVPIIKIVTTF